MKIRTALLCTVLAATTAVVARAAQFEPPSAPVAGKTRAEVKAETLRALAAGEVTFGDVGYPDPRVVPTPRSRVRAKAVAASPRSAAAGGPAS